MSALTAVREKPRMMDHCKPLSVGLVGGAGGGGGGSHIQRETNSTTCLWGWGWGVLVGCRLRTPRGLGDSQPIKWESAGRAANLSGRHPAIPTPSITPPSSPHRGRTHPHNASRVGTPPVPLLAAPLMSARRALAAFCRKGPLRQEIRFLRWKRSKAVKAGGAAQPWQGRWEGAGFVERQGETERDRAGGSRKSRGALTPLGSRPRQ